MSFSFPNSPTVGQEANGYIWDGQKWVRIGVSAGPGDFLPLSGGTLTGPLDVQAKFEAYLPPATYYSSYNVALPDGPSVAAFYHGSDTNFVTTRNPTVGITRLEAVNATGTGSGENAALYVQTTSFNSGTPAFQSNGICALATQYGPGDVCAIMGVAELNSTTSAPRMAFGAYFTARATSPNSLACCLEFDANNNSGTNYSWATYSANPLTAPVVSGIDANAGGANLHTVGLSLRGSGGNARWDVGVGALPNSVLTAFLQDDSSSGTSLKVTGSHTNGVDLTGGTFSGNPFKSTGFAVSPTGAVTTPAVSVFGAPAAAVTINASNTSIDIANGANGVLPIASGLIVIREPSITGASSVWLVGAGLATLIAQTGTLFVASTTSPPAGNVSIAFNGTTGFAIYNNRGGPSGFYVVQIQA